MEKVTIDGPFDAVPIVETSLGACSATEMVKQLFQHVDGGLASLSVERRALFESQTKSILELSPVYYGSGSEQNQDDDDLVSSGAEIISVGDRYSPNEQGDQRHQGKEDKEQRNDPKPHSSRPSGPGGNIVDLDQSVLFLVRHI